MSSGGGRRRVHQRCRTFGVASVSYYLSRVSVSAAITNSSSMTISFFVLCASAGAPSWVKTEGEDVVTWVGFEHLHRMHQLGISQRRAAWFIKWTRQMRSQTVNSISLEDELGRVMFVAGALEYERPFPGTLSRFLSLHPQNSVRLVPHCVKFFLDHLARQLEVSRRYLCAIELHSLGVAPRVDAQASEDNTGIGSWAPVCNSRGELDPWLSPRFSHELTNCRGSSRREATRRLSSRRSRPSHSYSVSSYSLVTLHEKDVPRSKLSRRGQTTVGTVPPLTL